MNENKILTYEELKSAGVYRYGIISVNDIVFDNEIRKICEKKRLQIFRKNMGMSPAVGSVEECKKK